MATAACLGTIAAGADDKPYVAGLSLAETSEGLNASWRLDQAFDDEFVARVESGLPTTLSYEVTMERLRRWWFDRTLYRSLLEITTMYNAVTREYQVNVRLDGNLIQSRSANTREELEVAMTHVEDFALPSPTPELFDNAGQRIVVRVRAVLGPKTFLLLFPTTRHTEWTEVPLLHRRRRSGDTP